MKPTEMYNKLKAIEEEITEYHKALDNRGHGGIAQGKCLRSIMGIMRMPWVQGATLEERANPGPLCLECGGPISKCGDCGSGIC